MKYTEKQLQEFLDLDACLRYDLRDLEEWVVRADDLYSDEISNITKLLKQLLAQMQTTIKANLDVV